jgi:hypothetical protein
MFWPTVFHHIITLEEFSFEVLLQWCKVWGWMVGGKNIPSSVSGSCWHHFGTRRAFSFFTCGAQCSTSHVKTRCKHRPNFFSPGNAHTMYGWNISQSLRWYVVNRGFVYSIMFLYRLTQHTECVTLKLIYLFTITICFDHLSVVIRWITYIGCSFELQTNLPIWTHIYNVNIFTIYQYYMLNFKLKY